MAAERYRVETYRLPAASEELFTAELWSRGVLGVEVDAGSAGVEGAGAFEVSDAIERSDTIEGRAHVLVRAWFTETAELGTWQCSGVERIASEVEIARDWLAEYRQSVEPLEIGSFVIDARDARDAGDVRDASDVGDASDARASKLSDDSSDEAEAAASRYLSIPAQTAFGTGSHESTRLVVRWLEELRLRGLQVIDVGVGSGILSFVAERLGAAGVVGFDFDVPSVCIAQQNARHNRCAPRLVAARLATFRPAPAFDLALVNVLPERVLPEYPQLLRLLRPGARVISSGNLVARRQELADEFTGLGLAVEGEKQEGDWLAFLLRWQ